MAAYINAQRKIATVTKPALWVPGVRNFHSEKQHFTFSCSVDEAMRQTWAAAEALAGKGFVAVSKDSDTRVVKIQFLTKAKWMDEITLSFHKVDAESTGCAVHNGSTGFLPLIVPLAPVINLALFWIPFADGGKCGQAMAMLRKQIDADNAGQIEYKVVRYSITNPKKG